MARVIFLLTVYYKIVYGMQKQYSYTMSCKCHWCYHVISTIILKSEYINKTWHTCIVFGYQQIIQMSVTYHIK
jgi:hypothetical protein